MYYKLLEEDGSVIQVFNSSIDDFLDLRGQYGESFVEEIKEPEYKEYKKSFEKMDTNNIPQGQPVVMLGDLVDAVNKDKPSKKEQMKMYIFDAFFENQYALPTTEQLEDYYIWLTN